MQQEPTTPEAIPPAPPTLDLLLQSSAWKESTAQLPLALGSDVAGNPIIKDLSSMQHLLIGCSNPSEKDVMLRTLIACLVCCKNRDLLRIAIVGEVASFANNGTTSAPNPFALGTSMGLWRYLTDEMAQRSRRLATDGSQFTPSEQFPCIVCIVSELADCHSASRDATKDSIVRVARFGHHFGIHLILATAYAERRIVRSSIKANIPARIAFKLPSSDASRVISDLPGAESLSGAGDALFTNPDTSETIPIQTPIASMEQMQAAVGDFISKSPALWLTEAVTGSRTIAEGVGAYSFPSLDLLHAAPGGSMASTTNESRQTMDRLIQTLEQFNIKAEPDEITAGPVITRYEVRLAAGIRVERILNLEKNIAMTLMAESVRILAPVPGRGTVGIEIPNANPETVRMRTILESRQWVKSTAEIPIVLGVDVTGRPIVEDLTRMPHMLIAGSTNSGKTVCINAIIASLLYHATPEELRFIMIDPKVVEMQGYNALPHMLIPVITDPKKVPAALNYLLYEMERRYRIFAKLGVRNIAGFNREVLHGTTKRGTQADAETSIPAKKLPYIVCIIDELADLMMVAPQDVETGIARLAQLARAAGIHLILATQRPSANVITGVIKANLPTRIAFKVASKLDSRIILDCGGAESLIGRGDMLFVPPGASNTIRAQGAFIDDDEIQNIITYLQNENGLPEFATDVQNSIDVISDSSASIANVTDELMPKAIEIIRTHNRASTSFLQRKLKIGYNRAARIMDELREAGVVSNDADSKSDY